MTYETQGCWVSITDILKEYKASEPFRKQLDSGRYVYAENRLCLNHPKYIQEAGDGVTLTEYARGHEGECCLAFITTITLVDRLLQCETEDRRIAFVTRPEASASPSKYQEDPVLTKEHAEKFAETLKKVNTLAKKLPHDFPSMLKELIKDSGMKDGDIADRSSLSEKTIQRLRQGKTVPTLETMMQLCIGLRLHPILSDYFMKSAGLHFMDSDLHRAYRVLLDTCYPYTVEDCNALLKSQKLPTLGRSSSS